MRLLSYDSYKESGVAWLGEIPAHWTVKRLKFVCTIQTGDKDTVNAVDGGQYPFFVRSQVVERINSYTYNCEAILTAGDGVGVGKVFHYYNGPFDCHQRVYMLNNFQKISGRYLFFYLKENFYKVALGGGAKSTVDSLRMPLFLNFLITIPPPEEQSSIVAWLDYEASKIDVLLAEQRRLIQLLISKRLAFIFHAVSRGLNPEAHMIDSGIEWLGAIPSHWKIERLRWLIVSIEQGWSPQAEEREPDENEWGVLRLNAVKDGFFDPTKAKALPSDLDIPEALAVRTGDFLLTRANTPELVGESCYVDRSPPGLIFSDLIYRLNLRHSRIMGQFLNLVMQSPIGRSQIEADARGSSQSMVKISHDHILNWRIALPPIGEQKNIIAIAERVTEQLDAMIAEATRAIDLLQERRAALISAVVTGKFDVRGLVEEPVA
jgi:type I restriction enzyme S subunit